MDTKCSRCGRGLKDPTSIERGMGEVCAAKAAARDFSRRAAGREAQYEAVRVDPDCIWIVDLCAPDSVSVTNDAERVVGRILSELPGRRIIYRDSDNNWDELVHDGKRFTGFKAARDQSPDQVPPYGWASADTATA